MSDSNEQKPGATAPPGDTTPALPQEDDPLFRLQMAISDFVLGYWKWAVVAIGVVLLCAAAYGGWQSWQQSSRRADYETIAKVEYRMPKQDEAERYGLSALTGATDPARAAEIEEGARRFEAAAAEARGPAAAYGWMKAAEAWRRAGKDAESLAALEKAWTAGGDGILAFSAGSSLAAAQLDAGKGDDAVTTLRALVSKLDGALAEQALVSLASAQADLGKADDAKATIQEFRTRFPESPRATQVVAIESRLGSGS